MNKGKGWNGNVRDAALSILLAVQKNQAYSNLLLNRTMETYGLAPKDRALLTELTYGTIGRRMTLDYYLEPFVRGRLDDWVRELLRMSLYQIVYLTKIPPHAAVNEAVEIAKRRGHKGIAATVNGILRSVLRSGVRGTEEIADAHERISIETSHPKWLIDRWAGQYGEEAAYAMARQNNEPPSVSVRVNLTKTTVEEAVSSLSEEGFDVKPGEVVSECLLIRGGNVASSSAFRKGWITIQDESSMLPVVALSAQPGMKVLDMCAAPGGKSTFIAERMNDEGQVIACDLHEHKLSLIKSNSERLGLGSIETKSGDSRELSALYPAGTFDRVLVDAPCSGLGVIRRKPEIKYGKSEQDFENLGRIQSDLLETAYKLVKEDGLIVYSTCTVEKSENEEVARDFLSKHPDLEIATIKEFKENEKLYYQNGMLQVLPHHFGSDGFFVAAFKKRQGSK